LTNNISTKVTLPSVQYWVEKTIVKGRPDRKEENMYGLGKALWSPQRSKDQRDIYSNMRDVKPGDVILHLIDNSYFAGTSVVSDEIDETFNGIAGTKWGERPSYLIWLNDYKKMNPILSREDFLQEKNFASKLQKILKQPEHKDLFFTRENKLRQGAYLTKPPIKLVEALNNLYYSKYKLTIPHLGNIGLSKLQLEFISIDKDIENASLIELREKAIHHKSSKATPRQQKVQIYARSAAIKQYALKRSKGKCESCQKKAPFVSPNGKPFLEVHHIHKLSDGGHDDPNWVIALCPNCHRRAHYSIDANEFNKNLKEKVNEIERTHSHKG